MCICVCTYETVLLLCKYVRENCMCVYSLKTMAPCASAPFIFTYFSTNQTFNINKKGFKFT